MNTSHYPSLELCKKLQSEWFPETDLGWLYSDTKSSIMRPDYMTWNNDDDWLTRDCCAPSVMELLDEMPRDIHVWPHQYTWSITPYWFTYSPNQSHSTKTIPFFSTDINSNISIDPNALAEIWLWLKENGYLLIK